MTKNPQKTAPQNNKPLLLLDTDIIANLTDKVRVVETLNVITMLQNSYTIAVSQITHYEVVCKGTPDVNVLLNVLNRSFKTVDIDRLVLVVSGLMHCIGIKDVGDSVIAATAFINNCKILTSNQNDFREPNFHEESSWSIRGVSNNRSQYKGVYLISTDPVKIMEAINDVPYVKSLPKEKSS